MGYLGSEQSGGEMSDSVAAELEAYNRAFCELELPWRWDAQTFLQLQSAAPDRDFVGTYVERSQAHLLRVYEKAFLRDLVLTAKDRCRQDSHSAARSRAVPTPRLR